ncbi:VanZ family protein [Flavobacterium sp. GT3R68]|uniref:VanZ family protein n=1 Tax=Flavobacterium sp. GT3R68 TaxID=2594437 RepID=UPI000F8742ED|nr:VanZ family protein [Flavobacterium sp. GT3R68]RTY90025.1 VanZ family protein [Flavobacterium sp. GSN2]TRW93348.1 VanZ family protein [Flavobacterium sp. GT3R68]
MPKVSLQSADKYVHFTFHFVFTWLWFLYFESRKNELGNSKTIFLVFLLSFLYGISVEIMQGLFTLTRKADLFDVLANTVGALTAAASILVFQKYIRKEKSL